MAAIGDLDIRIDIDQQAIDPNEVSFWLTVTAISLFILWGTIVVFYFSRISAIFFTFIIDKYLRLSKNGIHFRIGSISISGFHAGKIMFRNVIYDNGDMTLKINDGHLIFKYWKPVENRHLDLKKNRASRLQLVLNGLHVNVYNNLTKYSEIAKIRRFDWFFETTNIAETKKMSAKPPDNSPPSSVWENIWNLIGMINIEVSSGCFLVGNKFLPYALWARFENMGSKVTVSESENDRALLTFKGDMENVSVSLIKNEKFQFTERERDPPRTTGNDGFPLLQSASLEFVYKQDLLGYVTDDEPQSITNKIPVWTSEWKFGNNTVLSYGPWAEQQRVLIYSFFYPPDYQNTPVTIMPCRGQKRVHVKHDVNIILTKETCIDIWFMRGDQLESIRARCGQMSKVDMSVLWITTDKGFYWNMNANFVNFEASTSLLFTKLIESSNFSVDGSFIYPLTWNGEQKWSIEYTFTKATAWFVWDHKRLFSDLINDWIGEEPSDITKFVPFRVVNKMKVVDSFEVIMLLNECNWVDPSDMNDENVEVAIVGEKFTFECELPFLDFLPEIQKVKYVMKGEKGVAVRARFPPDSATAPIRAALSRLARCSPNAPASTNGTHSLDKDIWFEMWRTELVELKFNHQYHPIVLKNNIPSDIPFSVLSDYIPETAQHPWMLKPDKLFVDMIIEGSDVQFTGLLAKLVFELKNNYFGWYDSMTSIDESNVNTDPKNMKSAFDAAPRNIPVEFYRTMDVDFTLRIANIRAEMLVYSPAIDKGEIPERCPVVFVEEVVVEVKKTKRQAMIQVGISPACAYLDKSSTGTSAGCITLSGLQFRGQALYSSKDVTWDMGLVEYGWIMEILVGDIGGTLDFPAHAFILHQIVESFLIFLLSPDDSSKIPDRMQFCQHGQLTKSCKIAGKIKGESFALCKTEEQLKYRQIRVSIDSVDLAFVEDKTVIQLTADPIRVTVCNAHEGRFAETVCVRAPGISIIEAVRTGNRDPYKWVEGASLTVDGISLDIELPCDKSEFGNYEKEKLEFVKYHDKDTKRLNFLWVNDPILGCACFGNTFFFAPVDTMGSCFMKKSKRKKFFVPGIEKNSELQPMVMQSIIDRTRCILSGKQHLYYRTPQGTNQPVVIRKMSSEDTESFHSARSNQTVGNRLLQSAEMMYTYSEFINNLQVELPNFFEMPSFGEPGSIAKWCAEHPATKFIKDMNKRGMNDVKFLTKSSLHGNGAIHSKEPKKDNLTLSNNDFKNSRRLAINGVAAKSVDVFLSPIGLEGLERVVSSFSQSISAINPCLLVHVCYRKCVLNKHRQPLTESLFDIEHESELPPDLDISVDLPRINIGFFQCGIKNYVRKVGGENEQDTITANLALFLIDTTVIQSKSVVQKAMQSQNETLTASSNIDSNFTSTLYQMNFNVITAQLLQMTSKDAADFGNTSNTMTVNNWEHCAISRRMLTIEPRVILDFNVSDLSIILERRPIMVITAVRPNVSTPFHSPTGNAGNKPATTPMQLAEGGIAASSCKKNRIIFEHYLKAAIGSITTSIVMARPQELTAGNEFPIYEALAPVMVSWINVIDNFTKTFNKIMRQWAQWKDVAMAKILKLALDCADEKVAVRVGKNRMAITRLHGDLQNSCASCLLLKTLFRWFAYSPNAVSSVLYRLDIRTEFEVEETRKMALMALLSHWQSDIGKELKLISYEDASRFKITRPDESIIPSLTKLGQKQKAVKPAKKETRITMDKRIPTKRGRLSPAPFLRKLRKRGGNDMDIDEENSDIEMQVNSATYFDDHFEEEEEEEEEEDEAESAKKNEHVDLYTWMRNAQRESALKRRALAGSNIAERGSGSGTPNDKQFINPMDIQQKAYFYSIYRWAKLQWSTLDDVQNDHWHMDYSLLLREVDVRMMAKSVKSSTDHQRRYITPAQQKVMQVRNAAVSGSLLWKLYRDEKKKLPTSAQWSVNYGGNIEGIRFLIGMATVSLGKELSLVMQAGTEAKREFDIHNSIISTPNGGKRSSVNATQYDQAAEWDEKVLDMTRDYEKHMQRMKTSRLEKDDTVKLFINGSASISSVVLESVLNDLYVSAMILKIDLLHSKTPIPDGIANTQNVAVTNVDERKSSTLRTSASLPAVRVDDISVSLTKMSLTLSESDSMNKKADILRCTLNSSSLNFYTKLQNASTSNTKINKSASSVGQKTATSLGKWAILKLGALEGNMPMAAHSLHDVVMRHGKELEEQFNRLSAQPASTPLGSHPGGFESAQPSLTKIENKTVVTPLEFPQPRASPFQNKVASVNEKEKQQAATSRVPIVVVNFVLEVTSIEMNIQLLASLHAKYRIYRASSTGITGDKAKWNISLDEHFFEFCVTGKGGKTETFRLQLPSVKCTGHYSVEQGSVPDKPSTDKKLVYREGGSMQMTVLLGSVNHMFTTELLNQLMFAEHSFRTELTALINRIRSSSSALPSQPSTEKQTLHLSHSSANFQNLPAAAGKEKPRLLFSIKVLTKDSQAGARSTSPSPEKTSTPWLQLTASTPTLTAVRLTIDSLEGELTNKWVVQEAGSKERIYGSAIVHFNAKLGQMVKPAEYDEVSAELQEYATFMTQVRVENKERNMLNSAYSYHISLNRPILLVKAAAIDKAILLWLNYKNTYDYWRSERDKVVLEKEKEKTKKQEIAGAVMFSPTQIAEDADMNLSLAINNGMYMCMPLYSHDVTEGMPALVLSLQRSELSVLVKKELTCKASFNGFKLSFVDDFDEQALTQSFLDVAHSVQSNCFFFPEGTYQLCSKATASNGPAKWMLSVSAEMQGVEIDLDQRIGKLTKLLVNTCSMIGKDDDDDLLFWEDQRDLDSDEEKVDGADELKRLKAEERVPWVENKMHEHSRAVFELASRGVSMKKLEAEQHKLRQYELIRFKAFRRNMVEKLRRDSNTVPLRPNSQLSNNSSPQKHSEERKILTNSGEKMVEESKSSPSKSQPETVNFNLDVKVNITSGTCTLRTAKKESVVELDLQGQIHDALKRLNQGSRDIKAMFEPPVLTTTSFSIPSVEIKAYHVSDPSETMHERFGKRLEKEDKLPKEMAVDAEKLNRDLNSKSRFGVNSPNANSQDANKNVSKRGCFYMFIGLASMPTETVVTPHLATYVEQVLEPLPASAVFRNNNSAHSQNISTIDQKNDDSDMHNIVAIDTASFPIDFVLYLDVQSSTIRFDGKQQTSRTQALADCLLTLPRLTLEISSKKTKSSVDSYVGGIYISGQFKGFLLKIYNPLEPELDSSRALLLSLDLLSFVISRNKNSSSESDNRVRFVFTSQIGKASFEYNFRRLGELIQFPKPWYRAAIARRVFFGDQSVPRPKEDGSDFSGVMRSKLSAQKRNSIANTETSNQIHDRKPWTAMVLAAIQWNDIEVTAFMSNTMGKTTWNATKGLLWGDAKLNSALERDVTVSFVLGSSELCAREGAISGVIKLNTLRVYGSHSLSKDLNKPPINKAKVKLDWITANIEWMSRRVLIAKWTNPSVKISDYYNGIKEGDHMSLQSLGMDIEASWKDIQAIVTKSTAEDITAIVNRLIAFFDEQMKNSRILLGNFSNSNNPNPKRVTIQTPPPTRKPTTHFWEKVLDYVSEMQINEQLMTLMEREGAKVGGNVKLKAGGISLVLMKGDMNADTWAVFHLRDASISFCPEAKMDFLDQETKQKIGILMKHSFCLNLGSREENRVENLANVCRVQTRFNGSRHLHKTEEILEYFIGEVMKTLGLHHSKMEKRGKGNTGVAGTQDSPAVTSSSSTSFTRLQHNASVSKKGAEKSSNSHNVLELFQFPGLEAKMTSEQLNGLDDDDNYESAFQIPMEVITTFICDFYSEVAIETNFNAQVSFLPELLKSYFKDNTNSQITSSSTSSPTATKSSSLESNQPDLSKDPRVFICRQWQVEPRVRFIDTIKWTPPVVDEILKKLQIFDHRNTIPKVIQRAVLDPLDATLATSVIATLQLIDNKKTIKNFKKSHGPPEKGKNEELIAPRGKDPGEVSVRIDIPLLFPPVSSVTKKEN